MVNLKLLLVFDVYQYKMQGLITYIVGDDISSTFVISWKLPISSYGDYFVYYLSGKKYKVEFQYGFQNTALQVTIYPPTSGYPNYPTGQPSRYQGYPSSAAASRYPTTTYPWALPTPPIQNAFNV